MEIVAHALWATAVAKAAQRKAAPRLHAGWFALWAMFPDVLAFGPEIAAEVWRRVFGGDTHRHVHHLLGFDLYEPGHSLVVAAGVFAVASLLLRRPAWAVLGWALHIAMDIPTHTARYPTPFLWPVSSYRIIGISWRQWWFMAVSYGALAGVFLALWLTRRAGPRAGAGGECAAMQASRSRAQG
jgi:hypothetical protein